MIFIPMWITNLLLLLSCIVSAYQHARLNRKNPFATLQFGIILFSLFMMVTVVVASLIHRDRWLSLLFFLIAATVFFLAIRQFRFLPPKKSYE